jgi:hypothetical protein
VIAFVFGAVLIAPLTALPVQQPAAAAAKAATAAGPSRHLEYAVTEKDGDDPSTSTLDLEVGEPGAHGLSVRLVDHEGTGTGAELDAQLDRLTGMTVTGEGGFSDREEVLLSLFALSFDNVGGLEKGAKWSRVAQTPDGTATTAYEVRGAIGSLVELSVQHAVADAGWISLWQGTVVYDTLAGAPTRVELTGQSALHMKLAAVPKP